jgi:hypothetical protein
VQDVHSAFAAEPGLLVVRMDGHAPQIKSSGMSILNYTSTCEPAIYIDGVFQFAGMESTSIF